MTRLTAFLTIAALALSISSTPTSVLADEPAENPAALFDALDTNGDGTLADDEVDDEQRKAFDRLLRVGDANEDGKLTREEYLQGLKPDDPVTIDPHGGRRSDGQQRMDVGRLFQMADRDGDGKVKLTDLPDQMQSRLKPLFERLGKEEMTREDFDRFRRDQGGRPSFAGGDRPKMALIKALDENGNGQISKDELAALADKFSELDRNDDGQLSAPELMGFGGGPPPGMMARRDDGRPQSDGRPERKQRPDGSGNKPQSRLDKMTQGRPRSVDDAMKRFDKDGDGRLSKEEAPEQLRSRFDRIDTDADGSISKDELQNAFERRNQSSKTDRKKTDKPQKDRKKKD